MICETLSRVAIELDEIAMTHRPFGVPVTESRCSVDKQKVQRPNLQAILNYFVYFFKE